MLKSIHEPKKIEIACEKLIIYFQDKNNRKNALEKTYDVLSALKYKFSGNKQSIQGLITLFSSSMYDDFQLSNIQNAIYEINRVYISDRLLPEENALRLLKIICDVIFTQSRSNNWAAAKTVFNYKSDASLNNQLAISLFNIANVTELTLDLLLEKEYLNFMVYLGGRLLKEFPRQNHQILSEWLASPPHHCELTELIAVPLGDNEIYNSTDSENDFVIVHKLDH